MEIVSSLPRTVGPTGREERKRRENRLHRTGRKSRPGHRQRRSLPGALFGLSLLLFVFFMSGPILRLLDATAAVLDPGVLSLLLYGLICALALVLCSWWLQQLLWYPLRVFGNQFHLHFDQLLPVVKSSQTAPMCPESCVK